MSRENPLRRTPTCAGPGPNTPTPHPHPEGAGHADPDALLPGRRAPKCSGRQHGCSTRSAAVSLHRAEAGLIGHRQGVDELVPPQPRPWWRQLGADATGRGLVHHDGDSLEQVRSVAFGAPSTGPSEPSNSPLRQVQSLPPLTEPSVRSSAHLATWRSHPARTALRPCSSQRSSATPAQGSRQKWGLPPSRLALLRRCRLLWPASSHDLDLRRHGHLPQAPLRDAHVLGSDLH